MDVAPVVVHESVPVPPTVTFVGGVMDMVAAPAQAAGAVPGTDAELEDHTPAAFIAATT